MREVMVGETADQYEKMCDLLCLLVTGEAERIYIPKGYNAPVEELFKKGEKHTVFWFHEEDEELHVRNIYTRSQENLQKLLENLLDTFVSDRYEWNDNDHTAIDDVGRVLAYGLTKITSLTEDVWVEWIINLDNLFEATRGRAI